MKYAIMLFFFLLSCELVEPVGDPYQKSLEVILCESGNTSGIDFGKLVAVYFTVSDINHFQAWVNGDQDLTAVTTREDTIIVDAVLLDSINLIVVGWDDGTGEVFDTCKIEL